LGAFAVNTVPQYIVDIASGTQDIAPVLQQMSKSVAIFGEVAGTVESCGNLSRKSAIRSVFILLVLLGPPCIVILSLLSAKDLPS